MTTYHAAIHTTPAAAALDVKRRSAIRGAFLTEFIDMFDIYLPVVVLAPVLAYFQPTHIEPGLAAILGSFVFITTLLGRPVGAFIFGRVKDRLGRRTSSIISVLGFGLFTLLIALLLGYQTIGVTSYVLLVLLRFLDGVCLGGGYTASHPWRWNIRARASAWRILATQLADGKPTPPGPIGLPLESQLAGPFPYDFTATDVPVRFVGKGVIADRLLSRPATFNVPARDELERALKHFKHEKDRSGGKGSHEKWTGPDERAFILPKRDPVSGHVFRTFLQHVGIDKTTYVHSVRPQL